jgi:hypothetical protein
MSRATTSGPLTDSRVLTGYLPTVFSRHTCTARTPWMAARSALPGELDEAVVTPHDVALPVLREIGAQNRGDLLGIEPWLGGQDGAPSHDIDEELQATWVLISHRRSTLLAVQGR